jgi:hypothetical protein
MSGTENNQTGTLDERLRLGAGFAAADRPRILSALSALAPHLSGLEHDQVELEVSLKDIEGPDQKVRVSSLRRRPLTRIYLAVTKLQADGLVTIDPALGRKAKDVVPQARGAGTP